MYYRCCNLSFAMFILHSVCFHVKPDKLLGDYTIKLLFLKGSESLSNSFSWKDVT